MNLNKCRYVHKNNSKNIMRRFDWIPARVVLYLLALNSMAIMYIIRIAITLTILAMAKEKPNKENFTITETLCFDKVNSTYVAPNNYGGTLDWSINQQYYVLTTFYWTYLLSHTISGTVVQKFGTKKTLGWSLVVSSLSQLCVPFSSSLHYIVVVVLQLIQGLSQGFIWPALYSSIGFWIPIHERSRFVTCFQGSALGIALLNVLAGFTIAEFGWECVFYATGGIGFANALLWYFLMHEKPEQHPRITNQELQYIQENREQHLHSEKVIPWCAILTSFPVWAVALSAFGRMWILAILTTYAPFYFKTTLGLSVEKVGLIVGLCTFVGYLSSLLFSFVSDKLIIYKLMPLVYIRKIFSVVGQISSGILFLTMGYIVECNIPLVIALVYSIQMLLMANFVGTMTNIVDISPNYAGPVSSFVQIILLIPTVLSTYVMKTFLQTENQLLAWRYTFSISCGVVIITSTFYAIFASAKAQAWDVLIRSCSSRDPKTENHLLKEEEV